LFNWLAPHTHGAIVWILFAGSGALGLEALSRGAAHVVMVDESRPVIENLRQQLAKWQTENVDVYQACVPKQLLIPDRTVLILFSGSTVSGNLYYRLFLSRRKRIFG